MDIGVMLVPDMPWTSGKCGYKVIQYMACGLLVVDSSVGEIRGIFDQCLNSFLAGCDDEWYSAMSTLLNDAKILYRGGAAGRREVEGQIRLQVPRPRLVQLWRTAAERKLVV
jgi:glycosyltransferase involved in cell wall biosynthesis